MSLNADDLFSRLQEATKKIEKNFYEEITVELDKDGDYVVLGTLSSEEESQVHEYASMWDKLPYLIRMKHDRLAFAVKDINGIDLRGVEMIKDKKGSGTTKREFIRNIVQNWDETIVHYLNNKLNEATEALQERVNQEKEAETSGEGELAPFASETKTEDE